MRRGEVRWGRPVLTGGSRKRRPFVIVSMDEFNTNDAYPKILAVHLTTATRGSYPWEVALPKGAANLPSRSTAKCGEVYTLLKDHLLERIGTLSRDDMKRIDAALRVALSLDRE